MNWIPVTERMPDPEKPVAVAIAGTQWDIPHWARAVWIPKHHKEDGEFEGELDWSDDEEHAYWPEGWYEWNKYDEYHWRIDHPVTHWAEVELPQMGQQL